MNYEIKNALEIEEQCKNESVSLWYYDGVLYNDSDTPLFATWIGDIEQGEKADFIEDFTKAVLESLEGDLDG